VRGKGDPVEKNGSWFFMEGKNDTIGLPAHVHVNKTVRGSIPSPGAERGFPFPFMKVWPSAVLRSHERRFISQREVLPREDGGERGRGMAPWGGSFSPEGNTYKGGKDQKQGRIKFLSGLHHGTIPKWGKRKETK